MKKIKNWLTINYSRIAGFMSGWWAVIAPDLRPRIFYGYSHYKWAKKYATRRHKADNKTYYVLPMGRESLIVVNSLELDFYQRTGAINRQIDIKQILESAYFRANKETTKTKKHGNT